MCPLALLGPHLLCQLIGFYDEVIVLPVYRSKCVRFSPTGREFAVASTEGLLLYSLNTEMSFDPIELDIEITPDTIRDTLKRRNFSRALVVRLIAAT